MHALMDATHSNILVAPLTDVMGPLGNAIGKLESVFIRVQTTPMGERAALDYNSESRQRGAAFIDRVHLQRRLGML